MFLVTTADQRFWKNDEPVLFLGEWCKLFSKRQVWEKLSYEVLPYHWDDRKKLYQDYLYLDSLYEQLLHNLAKSLNQIHNTDHSVRYWRIVIGPWLFYFTQILYDRYLSILAAAKSGKVTNTLIGRYRQNCWIIKNFPQMLALSREDPYNHYLYSRIIEYTKLVPFEYLELTPDSQSGYKKQLFAWEKPSNNYFTRCYQKLIPDFLNQIVLIYSYLGIRDLFKLQLGLRQLPYLFAPQAISPESNIDWDLRKKLSSNSLANEFEQLLEKLIKEQMPSIYLEGYTQMNKTALEAYPQRPKAILTASAYNTNEAFKFWAAQQVENGAKLAGLQHGGHNGTGLWSSTEKHEIKIYDRLFTWGWCSETENNTKPLSAARLNPLRRNVRPKTTGRLLMALTTMPRYSYYMFSFFVASSGTLAYFNDQYRFVRALSKENQKLLLVRLYQHDWGWNQKERWAREFPEVECYGGKKSMFEQLKESRLFIGTYNATTYLETFAANFPTVLFWNPEHSELRPSAQPYFDQLRRVGILHDTPESVATQVNQICDDPLSWWMQSDVQAAKDKFCHQFVRMADNWVKEWKEELRKLKHERIEG